MQRLFGVRAAHVQTGGGGAKGEIVLEAVGDDDVRELRALLARPAAGAGGGGAPGRSAGSSGGCCSSPRSPPASSA